MHKDSLTKLPNELTRMGCVHVQSRRDAELLLVRVHLDGRRPARRNADARPVPPDRGLRRDVPLPPRTSHHDNGRRALEHDGGPGAADRRQRFLELGLDRRYRRRRGRGHRAPPFDRPCRVPRHPPAAPKSGAGGGGRHRHGAAAARQGS